MKILIAFVTSVAFHLTSLSAKPNLCPQSFSQFYITENADYLVMNTVLIFLVFMLLENLLSVRQILYYTLTYSIMTTLPLFLPEKLAIDLEITCSTSVNIHLLAILVFEIFSQIRMKNVNFLGLVLNKNVPPYIFYSLLVLLFFDKRHFKFAVYSLFMFHVFKLSKIDVEITHRMAKDHQRRNSSHILPNVNLTRAAYPRQPMPFPSVGDDKLKIDADSISQHRLNQLVAMGFDKQEAILALSATGFDQFGKPISTQDSIQKAIDILQFRQKEKIDRNQISANVEIISTNKSTVHQL